MLILKISLVDFLVIACFMVKISNIVRMNGHAVKLVTFSCIM